MTPPQTAEEALDELRQVRDDLARLTGVRERAIRSAYAGGASLRVIAEACGLGKDTVRRVLLK